MNARELKIEINKLEDLAQMQAAALKNKVSSPRAVFSLIFPRMINRDYLQIVSRLLLPLALNKTLFRHSNFLIKALVGLVSQKAAGYITEGTIMELWHKIQHGKGESEAGQL